MTVNRSKCLIAIALFLFISVGWHPSVVTGNGQLMSREDLKDRIGDPDTLILDVRTGSDWTSSARKIRGALRFDPENFNAWVQLMPKGKTIVFY